MKRAIFLDRDGVINKKPAEHDYVKKWEEMEILPDAKEAISLIKKSGYLVVVVSNQRGVARGLMTHDDVRQIHESLNGAMEGMIDAFYYCPHGTEEECNCRKPRPGLVNMAAEEMDIDLEKSWIIGDSPTDVECGFAAGIKVVMMESDTSLMEAVKKLP